MRCPTRKSRNQSIRNSTLASYNSTYLPVEQNVRLHIVGPNRQAGFGRFQDQIAHGSFEANLHAKGKTMLS